MNLESSLPYSFSHPESILQFVRKETHQAFTLERADILTQVPIPYKRKFGQIVVVCGVTSTTNQDDEKQERPALLVSPFDVPPGEIRREWMQAFLQARSVVSRFKHARALVSNP